MTPHNGSDEDAIRSVGEALGGAWDVTGFVASFIRDGDIIADVWMDDDARVACDGRKSNGWDTYLTDPPKGGPETGRVGMAIASRALLEHAP